MVPCGAGPPLSPIDASRSYKDVSENHIVSNVYVRMLIMISGRRKQLCAAL